MTFAQTELKERLVLIRNIGKLADLPEPLKMQIITNLIENK
ncbi:hypothetical protein ACFPYJ_01595 [Paenibacillus solisilvae]|uniref:Uncharacterized protein n=1 Tax=Paenibacillus solisilvae TaxID=2486751 RepID=A0ABW0VQS1_9BACL